MNGPRAYTFGPFRLDADRRQLTRGDQLIALRPKAFDTLLTLIQARDRVVTKEELLSRLWPDVMVEEASLTQQVFAIRKALQTESESVEYIATIPRSGYRFVQPVQEAGALREKTAESHRRFVWLAGVAVVAALLGVAALPLLRTRAAPSAKAVLDVLPPDGLSLSNSIALSPDGKYLAFTAAGDDSVPSLWLRAIASDDVWRLPGTDGARYPFWAPASDAIAFFADGKLKRLTLDAGPPRIVNDHAPSPRGGTWGDRDTIVFAPSGSALFRVAADGGAAEPVTLLDAGRRETDHRWPTFLPGGRHILFMTRSPGAASRYAIAVAPVDGPPRPHRILTSAMSPGLYIDGHLLFVRGRTLLTQPFDLERLELLGSESTVQTDIWRSQGWDGLQGCTAASQRLVACRTGATDTQLAWVDRSGREIRRLDLAYAANPELSHDGNMIAFAMYDEEREHEVLAVHDLARRGTQRLTTGNMENQFWSPDGTRLIFGAEVGGGFDLHGIDASGSGGDQRLLDSNDFRFPRDWSRDGKWLLYSDARRQLMALSLADKHRTGALLPDCEAVESGRFSRDTRWIAYGCENPGGSNVYVRPFPGPGKPWLVSTRGGGEPRWRDDGREIYFVRPDRRLVAVSVEEQDGQLRFDREHVVFDARTYNAGHQYSYDVTGDGKQFLITQLRDRSRIKVLINWRGP